MNNPDGADAPSVAICSLVRNGMVYLGAYRRQLESLDRPEGLSWRLYILEGDSDDGSQEFLQRWADEDPRVTVGKEDVGDATGREDRAARWARVGNACLSLVPASGPHTHVLWLEADLSFPPELLHRLVDHHVDVVAPVIFLGGYFYDTWGFRDLSGSKWRNEAPYHPRYRGMSLIEMGSVGSCVLFSRAVLDAGIRMKGTYEDGLLVGMCNDARARGFKVFADTATAILHPVDRWEEQMWRPVSLRLVHVGGREERVEPQQARGWGLEMNLPLLDADTLLRAQTALWRDLFTRLDTNQVEIEVTARARPRKVYDLLVRALAPSGAAGITALRGRLLRMMRRDPDWSPTGSDASRLRTKLLQKTFRCDVRLTMDPTS